MAGLQRYACEAAALLRLRLRGRQQYATAAAQRSFSDPALQDAEPEEASGVGAKAPTPAELDTLNGFMEGESVQFWREWSPPRLDNLQSLPAVAAALAAEAQRELNTADDAAYYAYHAARSLFFTAQGVGGLLASAAAGNGTAHPVTGTPLASPQFAVLGLRLLAEAAAMFRQDRASIRSGHFKAPWDMTSPLHRQYRPSFVARRSAAFLQEAAATISRRRKGEPDPVWLASPLYPDYYLSTWHYQTDGWLSSASARVYDNSTETLFIGRQDAMQRAALIPLLHHLRSPAFSPVASSSSPPSTFPADAIAVSSVASDATAPAAADTAAARSDAAAEPAAAVREGAGGAGPRVLDVGCGTGRLLTFVRDNVPAAEVTALDLSPFYLQEARELHRHWEELRGGRAGPRERSGAPRGSAEFVQAAAEALPFPDGHFDAVTMVYLLHELPPAARERAAAEAARVLAPGGVLVVADSIQLGDRPRSDSRLGSFGDLNEPNYRSFIELDVGGLFKQVGLEPWSKEVASASKVLSFRKPAGMSSASG